MIQITKWTNGAVIYVAQAATNIREVVTEAARSGADLSRAYLSWADLSGANLSRAYLSWADLSGANLSVANLSRADLSGANLSVANLSGADLSVANLSRADLSGADLSRAYLSGANLSGADLSGAVGFNKYRTNPLHAMAMQQGPLTAYKLVTTDGYGPFNGGIKFVMGQSYEVADADTNEGKECGAGINVATLPWCMAEWKDGYRIFQVEHTAADIAAIPLGTDGKYRLHRCKVVAEVDLKMIGLTT